MNDLINFLTSKEIVVVCIVAAIACILCFIVYIIDKTYYKRKQRHNTRELNRLVSEINEKYEDELPVQEEVIYDTPVMETIASSDLVSSAETTEPETEVQMEVAEPTLDVETLILNAMPEIEEVTSVKSEDELQYTTVEPNKEEAQEELMRLAIELEKKEQESKNIDLTAYEEDQEANAIISLDELMQRSQKMYEANELTQYEDEGNVPISLADLERKYEKELEPTNDYTKEPEIIETLEEVTELPHLHLDDFNTITKPKEKTQLYQTTKKFETSPIISPIYGIERKETAEEIALENTANYEKLDEEIKKTNEFLMTLRELQKNLD